MSSSSRSQNPLRIGILGCANIARQFTRDVAGSPIVQVAAVASRDAGKAAAFAAANGIDGHYGSYEALLSDPALDAVYLPLPNSMHAEWAIRAAEHGKHVLCEKPLALTRAQAQAMFDAAGRHGVALLEAYPWYFQPQTAAMLALLAEGAIGAVRSVQACFGFTVGNLQSNIRMKPELGGGALLDAGSYTVSLIQAVMGCAPQQVMADAQWAETGVDINMAATLYYADGRRAQMSCAMDTANHRHATIMGSEGTVYTEFLNHTSDTMVGHPYGYLPSQLRIRRGIANTVPFDTISTEAGSGFRFAAEAFAKLVAQRDFATLARAAAASLDIAATLEALAQSARTGQRVAVGARA